MSQGLAPQIGVVFSDGGVCATDGCFYYAAWPYSIIYVVVIFYGIVGMAIQRVISGIMNLSRKPESCKIKSSFHARTAFIT